MIVITRQALLEGSSGVVGFVGHDIEKISQIKPWKPMCDECKKPSASVVQLGDVLDYESRTVWICLFCIRKSLAILDSEGSRIDGRFHVC